MQISMVELSKLALNHRLQSVGKTWALTELSPTRSCYALTPLKLSISSLYRSHLGVM